MLKIKRKVICKNWTVKKKQNNLYSKKEKSTAKDGPFAELSDPVIVKEKEDDLFHTAYCEPFSTSLG